MIVVGLAGGMGQGKSTISNMLRELAGVDYKADLETSYPISAVLNEWMATWPSPLVLGPDNDVVSLANTLIETLPEILERETGKKTDAAMLSIGLDEESRRLHSRLIKYLSTWTALGDTEREVQLPTPITPENKGLHRSLLQWIGGVTVELVTPTIWSDMIDHRIKQLSERGYMLVTVGGIRYKHDADTIHNNGGTIVRVIRPEVELSNDVTETSSNEVTADTEVINDGTLDELKSVASVLFNDLKNGSVKPKYEASQA